MRLTLLCLFIVNFYSVSGQVLCKDIPSGDLYGDYPPGCDICFFPISSSNIGYTPDDTINFDFPCGEVENSVWYTFYSRGGGIGNVQIVTTSSRMGKGIEAAVFDEDFNRVSNCILINPQTSRFVFFTDDASQRYHLMIDGIDGDECEFRITNNSTPNLRSTMIYVDPPDANYCVDTEVCFTRERDLVDETYEWTVPETDSIISGGVNEEEICLYLKTAGLKYISLNVVTPCLEEGYFQNLEVNEGQFFAIDSFTAIYDKLCIDEEIRFEVGWDNDSILLDWQVPTSHFQRLDGGFLSSNYYVGNIFNTGDVTVSVTPLSECGIRYDYDLNLGNHRREFLTADVCSESCFVVGDSCYFFSNLRREIEVEPTVHGCDSTVSLRMNMIDIFPSPRIDCEQIGDSVLVEWERLSGVDSTIVFVNRDSIATTADNFYLIENVPTTLIFDVKIQPKGICTYIPAEIKCDGVVNTKSNFINNKILVYPNPTTGDLTIETDLKIEEINIFDVSGRFLQKEKRISFDLKYRMPGIYFLKIRTDEGVAFKKILMN